MVIVEADVVAWWDFKDGGGVTLTDETGVNDGTLTNSPTWGTTGVPSGLNGYLTFNGTTHGVNIPNNASLDVDNLTIIVWSKWTNGAGNRERFLTATGNKYFLSIIGANELEAFVTVGATLYEANHVGSGIINTWTMYSNTYDGSTLECWKNAVSVGSNATPSGNLVALGANDLNIARDGAGGGYYEGDIGQAIIFNRKLDATEQESILNSGNGIDYATFFAATEKKNGLFVGGGL